MEVTIPEACRSFATREIANAKVKLELQGAGVPECDYFIIYQHGRFYPMLTPSEKQITDVMHLNMYKFRR